MWWRRINTLGLFQKAGYMETDYAEPELRTELYASQSDYLTPSKKVQLSQFQKLMELIFAHTVNSF